MKHIIKIAGFDVYLGTSSYELAMECMSVLDQTNVPAKCSWEDPTQISNRVVSVLMVDLHASPMFDHSVTFMHAGMSEDEYWIVRPRISGIFMRLMHLIGMEGIYCTHSSEKRRIDAMQRTIKRLYELVGLQPEDDNHYALKTAVADLQRFKDNNEEAVNVMFNLAEELSPGVTLKSREEVQVDA